MASKKSEKAAAVGAAIAAGLTGPALQSGGRISYAPRLSETLEVNLSSDHRSNSLNNLSLLINGTPTEVQDIQITGSNATFEIDGRQYTVELVQSVPETATTGRVRKPGVTSSRSGAPGEILSPLPGIVSELLCKKGDAVTAGQLLLRIEAMKMQNNVYADVEGSVDSVNVSVGTEASTGQLLLTIK